jgi:predicted metal-dependent hydrolase
VGYHLEHVSRNSVGLVVRAQGLSVRAPRGMAPTAIESALHSKAAWIVAKLQAAQTQVQDTPVLHWGDGLCLPWLGAQVRVRWVGQDPPTQSTERVWREGEHLWIAGPHNSPDVPARLRTHTQVWAQREALSHFTHRLNQLAPRLGVRWTGLKLSSAATRWGSAKSDGSIRLHWRLMQFDPAVVDYVVAHELAHLRHMNHSPAFWRTVAEVIPDWPTQREQLRRQRLPVW